MNLPERRLSVKTISILSSLILSVFILENASAQSCSDNLLKNPGFEENIGTEWQIGAGEITQDALSGQSAYSFPALNGGRIWQFLPAQPGEEYTFSGCIKGNAYGVIGMKFLTADYQPDNLLTSKISNGNYSQVELTRTAPPNTAWIEVSFYSHPDSPVSGDDFCLVKGGGTTPSCQVTRTVTEGPCNDEGTNTDPSDDSFRVTVNATRAQPGGTYNLQIVQTNQNLNLSYSSPLTFEFPIAQGDTEFIFTDNEDPTCTETITAIAPPTCSTTGGNFVDLNLSVIGSPEIIASWQFGSTTFEIKNQGTIPASDVEVAFNIDVSAKLKGGDEYNASQGTLQSFWTQTPVWEVGNIPPGLSATIKLNLFTLAGDEIPVYGQVISGGNNDPDSSPNNGTPPNPNEDDEAVFTFNGDNSAGEPDLTMTDLQFQNSPIQAGQVLNYTFNASNIGTAAVPNDFSVKAYISDDDRISTDDIQDGLIPTGNFGAGLTVQDIVGASAVPAGLPDGLYFLILKIDADEVVAESDESNNTIALRFQVGDNPPLPDLAIENVVPRATQVVIGEAVSTYFDGKNFGEPVNFADFPIIYALYMSVDQTLDGNDVKILDLGLGIGDMQQFGGQVPPSLAPGEYYLIVEADPNNTIRESNEVNNWTASDLTVSAVPLGDGCGFITSEDTDPIPDFKAGNDYSFTEMATEFKITSSTPYSPFLNNPSTEMYRLGKDGTFIEATTVPQTFDWDVDLEVDSDDNLEMVFNQSPDVPSGTRIPIDYGFTNPTAVIPGAVFKTSTGYAFGMALVISGGSGLLNRIVQTDDFGLNVRVTDLPNPAFYSGFGRLTEGPNGALYTWWQTSGNYSMYVVPGDGSPGWSTRVATDTPSSTWIDTKASLDGNFVYIAVIDNQRSYVRKYNSRTGAQVGHNLDDFINQGGIGFRYSYIQGVKPTADGGLLLSISFTELGGGPQRNGDILGKIDENGNTVWRNVFFDAGFNVIPLGETSDGGAFYVGSRRVGMTAQSESVFVKVTASGRLLPDCGGPPLADLVVDEISTDLLGAPPGTQIFSFANILNQGNADAAGSSIRYYLSADSIVSPDDFRSLPISIPGGGIAEGEIGAPGFSFMVPSDIPNEFYLIVQADSEEEVTESNEDNNLGVLLLTVESAGSCAFIKNYLPQNADRLIGYRVPEYLRLNQTASGYTVEHSPDFNGFQFADMINRYELDLDGNVLTDAKIPNDFPYDVILETDPDENLEMIFNASPDVPAGTRVAIDYDYLNPADVIFGNVYKISTGYAFGLGIVDPTQTPLIINRIIKTDNFGGNVEVFEMENDYFFSGFGRLAEGSDGGIYTSWSAAGNFSVYGVPPGATEAWHYRVAGDTPSTTWVDTDVSEDGQFVFSAKTDNQRAFITKIDAATGTPTDLDLRDFISSANLSEPIVTRIQGIEPTPDGGLLASIQVTARLTSDPRKVVFGKFDSDGNVVWTQVIVEGSNSAFQIRPIGTTSDGGAFFAGFENRGQPSGDIETVFLKTTANGSLTPTCNTSTAGPDLELSFEPLSEPEPALWSFFPVTLLMTNNGTETVTNAEVRFTKADEVVYQGGNEYTASQGTFSPFGVKNAWFAGDLAPGETASLTVNYFRISGNPFTAYAQVFNMDQEDVDSTPQNGSCCTAVEDDEAALEIGSGALRGVAGRSQLADNISENEGFAILNAAPNPFSERLVLNIFSTENRSSDLMIYDVLGKSVFQKTVDLKEGHNSIEIDATQLRTGFLVLKMSPIHKYLRQIRLMKIRN